jgi:hypothetical protein
MTDSATWIGGPRCGEEVELGDDTHFYTASFHSPEATAKDVVEGRGGPTLIVRVPVEVSESGRLVLRWCPTYSHLL